MKIGIIIPAFNEAERLGDVLLKCQKSVGRTRMYVVDDGSTDRTAEAAEKQGVELLRHARNMGKGNALKTGFRKALSDGCEAVITMDGDGQHDPGDIQRLLAVLQDARCDIVLGIRSFRIGSMPLLRYLSNRISSMFVSLWSGQRIPDSQCGFRLIRSGVLEHMKLDTGSYVTESEFLIKAVRKGWKIAFCPIHLVYGGSGSHMKAISETFRFAGMLLRLIE